MELLEKGLHCKNNKMGSQLDRRSRKGEGRAQRTAWDHVAASGIRLLGANTSCIV